MSMRFTKGFLAVTVAAAAAMSGVALAGPAGHGTSGAKDQGHGHAAAVDFGRPGEASHVTQTIEVTMGDNYFEPESLTVEAGQTVRFVVSNDGEFLHEFNIGTAAMHAAHQDEMMTMMEHGMLTPTSVEHEMMKMDHSAMGMTGHVHDDPNSLLLEPGETAELIWTFTEATGLEFACNVPGHYATGMVGEITITE